MVFQRRAKKGEHKFHIGNETINIVHFFDRKLKGKGSSCSFKPPTTQISFSSLKPSLASNIFDTMISPILTHYSEVWGVYTKSDFKSWENSPELKKYTYSFANVT